MPHATGVGVQTLADLADVERQLALDRYQLLQLYLQNGQELRSVFEGSQFRPHATASCHSSKRGCWKLRYELAQDTGFLILSMRYQLEVY